MSYENIVFRKSAYWHKLKKEDILHAFMNPYYDGPIDESDVNNRFIRIGYDRAGNLLEIMYNEYKDCVCIFHAMKCRPIHLHLVQDIGDNFGNVN